MLNRGFVLVYLSERPRGSAHAPDTGSYFDELLDVEGIAEQPGKNCTTAATKPEATGELRPTVAGEQIRGRIVDRDVGKGDMRLLSWLVIEKEEEGQEVNGTDGC